MSAKISRLSLLARRTVIERNGEALDWDPE
jgi:hypothetical protein